MPKLTKSQAESVVQSMFNRREVREKIDELKAKVLPSIKDWAEDKIKVWVDQKQCEAFNPLLVHVTGVKYFETKWGEPNELLEFNTPLIVPAVGSVKEQVIGEVRYSPEEGYYLGFFYSSIFNRESSGDHPHYYEFDDKTNALIQAVKDYRDKAYDDKRKVEKLLEFYTGKDIKRIKEKDEFLYNVVVKVIGDTGGDGMPVPDNLADIVNSSETITVPDLKVLTCSTHVVEVVDD